MKGKTELVVIQATPFVFGLSIIERVARLRDQMNSMHDIRVLKNNYSSKAKEIIPSAEDDDDDDDGWGDWDDF